MSFGNFSFDSIRLAKFITPSLLPHIETTSFPNCLRSSFDGYDARRTTPSTFVLFTANLEATTPPSE